MKLVLIAMLLVSNIFATQIPLNMKNCETIQLSKFTVLISCHKIDYLVEYRIVEDEESDRVKKITAITPSEHRVIKNIGK